MSKSYHKSVKKGKYSYLEELEHSYETATMKTVAKIHSVNSKMSIFHKYFIIGTCLDEDDFNIFMPRFMEAAS